MNHRTTEHSTLIDPIAGLFRVRQRRTLLVFALTVVTMALEISFGYLSHSMALLADGWHMATHAGALFISLATYQLMKKEKLIRKLSFGPGKLTALGGYTNAVLLFLVSLFMIAESVDRFRNPVAIQYSEALLISCLGLLVNVISLFVLGRGQPSHSHGHEEAHDDHNYKSVYLHVISDAFTSVIALVALTIGKTWGFARLDSLVGVLGGVVILRWAYQLVIGSAWELLDGESKSATKDAILKEAQKKSIPIEEIRLWKVGPAQEVCILKLSKGRGEPYLAFRKFLNEKFSFLFLNVEMNEEIESGQSPIPQSNQKLK